MYDDERIKIVDKFSRNPLARIVLGSTFAKANQSIPKFKRQMQL